MVIRDTSLKGLEQQFVSLSRSIFCFPDAHFLQPHWQLSLSTEPHGNKWNSLIQTRRHCKGLLSAVWQSERAESTAGEFSSFLLIEECGLEEREEHCLCRWCRIKQFGFLLKGIPFQDEGLLAKDELELSKTVKKVFGRYLALNWILWQKRLQKILSC